MEDQNSKELHEQYSDPYDRDEVILEEDELTAMDRVLYAVTSPKRAFDRLLAVKQGSIIGVGLLIAAVLMIASTLVVFSSDTAREAMQAGQMKPLQEALDDPDISDSQRAAMEQQMEIMGSDAVIIIGGLISSILGIVIAIFVVGLLVFIIAKVLESGHVTRVRFAHALSVASLGSVIYALGVFVFTGILVGFTPSVLADGINGGYGIGAFAGSSSGLVTGFLSAVSPNMLWYYLVVGIGIAAISRASVMKAALSFGVIAGGLTVVSIVVAKMFGVG